MLEGRDWFGTTGAPVEHLIRLRALAPDLPKRYTDLLAFTDGGEGPLSIRPYALCLDPVATVAATIERRNYDQPDLHGFLIFGGNGGGDYIAFDNRHSAPWPIVTIDMVAGGASAERIASDFNAFYDHIGMEAA